MKANAGDQVYFGSIADYWFDKQGILFSTCKESPGSIETLKENFNFVKQLTGDKKVCLIADSFSTKACNMEMLKYSINEFPKVYTAIALVPLCPMGKMFGTIFSSLIPANSIPIKLFSDKETARVWITQYLN
jgi:hypothetical protein